MKVDIAVVKEANKHLQKYMKAIDAVIKLHKSTKDEWFDIGEMICEQCTREEYTQKYPCPTIQAITEQLK